MDRLKSAEQRLSAALSEVEAALKSCAQLRNRVDEKLKLVGHIEERAEGAIEQLKELIDQGRDGSHG